MHTKTPCDALRGVFIFSRNDITGGFIMENRVALIGIIVSNRSAAEKMNAILHEYGDYIIGRMGVPYKKRGISVISVVIDAPADVVSALSGKLGALKDVSTKTVYTKTSDEEE